MADVLAETYGSSQWRLVSVGKGPFESVEIRPGTGNSVLSAFELVIGHVYTGATDYAQTSMIVPVPDFPDPNGNLDQLAVEPATVRAFLRMGAGLNLMELSRSEAFLRRGGGGYAASLVGTVAVGTGGLYGGGGTLNGTVLTITMNGGTPVNVTFTAPAAAGSVRDAVNNAMGFPFMSLGSTFEVLSPTKGEDSSIVLSGAAAAILGFTAPNNSAVGGFSVTAVSIGQGSVTDTVQVLGADFTAAGTAAVVTGARSVSGLTYPADLLNKTLTLDIVGRGPQTIQFGSLGNQAALLSALNGFFPGITATVASDKLVLTSTELGTDAVIRVVGGSACELLGLVPHLTGRWALTTILPDLTTLNTKKLNIQAPSGTVEVTFSGFTGGSAPADVVTFLNGTPAFSAVAFASLESNALRIMGLLGGEELSVPHALTVLPASSLDAAPFLGLSRYDSSTFHIFEGNPNPPMSGDDLYVDGTLLGRIVKVAPNSVVTRLRIDKRITVASDVGTAYHIRARQVSTGLASRPEPELVVAGSGLPTLKPYLLRDVMGAPIIGKAAVHIAYRAVRIDLSAKAKKPKLLTVRSVTDLESILTVSSDNPLGLGLYLALLNAAGASVSGLGIDETSEDAPFGTIEAFTRAAEFLEAFDVYAIAPLTHDAVVGQVFSSHVQAMSLPENRSERMVVFNHGQPTRKLDVVVASGVDGNSVGSQGIQFDTGVSNLSSLVQNAGVNPVGTIPPSSALYLDIASDAKHYNISAINGSVVTIRKVFTAGQNDDAFFATTDLNDSPLPGTLINEPFAVRVRGDSLTRVDGTVDLLETAKTYQGLAQSIANRRFRNLVADRITVTLGGLDQSVEGFYACAARVGMVAGLAPQQGLTNYPMVGIRAVSGTNNYFTQKHLGIIAAGGNDILVQDVENGPITSWWQLTTDMSSIESREDSINRVVDYAAKFIRAGMRNSIGRFNITQGFIESLSQTGQGLIEYLVLRGILAGGSLDELIQDENAPDGTVAMVSLDPPIPCNKIQITLNI